jgi:hypothetical protein
MANPISAPLPAASAIVKNDPSRQSKQAMYTLQSYNQVYSCTVVVLQKKPQHKAGCVAVVTHHPRAMAMPRPLRGQSLRGHSRRGHGVLGRRGTAVVAAVALVCRPHRPAVIKLNTGFGGAAQLVARHHPADQARHRAHI